MSQTNKRCIVSLATKAGNYASNLARLSNSLRENFTTGDFLGFIHESTVDAPLHSDAPYHFKLHAIDVALDAGYKSILWLDTSCYAVGNVDKIFDDIEESGICFQDAGHLLGNWSSDRCLKYFNITRDEAMGMKMIGNAGFLGLDMKSNIGRTFYNKWVNSMDAGVFGGRWDNNDRTESQDDRCLGSRHDMSASSAIVHKMGLFDLAYSGDKILQYAGVFDKTINDTIIIKAQG